MPKETKIFDLNLFSGSSELIRQAFGGYFREIDGDVEFLSVDTTPISLTAPIMAAGTEEAITDYLVTNITGNILPSIRYPIRFRVQDNSEINSDQQWRTYVVGGTFGDTEYPGIYNESVYADHSNTSSLPYLPREIVNTQLQPDIQITTEYFNLEDIDGDGQSTCDGDCDDSDPNTYLGAFDGFGDDIDQDVTNP